MCRSKHHAAAVLCHFTLLSHSSDVVFCCGCPLNSRYQALIDLLKVQVCTYLESVGHTCSDREFTLIRPNMCCLTHLSASVLQGLLRDSNGQLGDGSRLAAGLAAGVTEALIIVTPFEVVKIRLQQQKGLAYHQLKYHVSSKPS